MEIRLADGYMFENPSFGLPCPTLNSITDYPTNRRFNMAPKESPPPRFLPYRLRMTIKIGNEKKNEHYGVQIQIVTKDGHKPIYSGEAYGKGSEQRLHARDTYVLFDTTLKEDAPIRPNMWLDVTVTSVHLYEGAQLEGIWEGEFFLECFFTDAKDYREERRKDYSVKSDASRSVRFNHEGSVLGGKKKVVQEFDIYLPAAPPK